MAGWWIQLELQLSDPEKNVEEFVFNFTNIVPILEYNSWRIVGGLLYGDNKLWKSGKLHFFQYHLTTLLVGLGCNH